MDGNLKVEVLLSNRRPAKYCQTVAGFFFSLVLASAVADTIAHENPFGIHYAVVLTRPPWIFI